MTMTESLYSLRWNNHPSHMLSSFGALLENKDLVDVTLVCAKGRLVQAHKVILSACSPLFQRIFSETPCEHPIVVLKDFEEWQVDTLINFMYKGEISIEQAHLNGLIKAAESLEIRGLASQDKIAGLANLAAEKDSNSNQDQTPTPSTSPNDCDRQYFLGNNKFSMQGMAMGTSPRSSSFSPVSNMLEPPVKLPHMSKLSFPETLLPRADSQSPIPRRKQARPRRRSGENGPQDLSTNAMKPGSPQQLEERAENLCIKKKEEITTVKVEERKSCSPEISMRSPEMDLSAQSGSKAFSPTPVSPPQPTIRLKQEIDSHSPMSFPPMPTVSALAMTPPQSKFYGLDTSLGLFQSSLENCRNPMFDIADHRNPVESPMFVKKKMGRPKGQHSAPRGGPPRSWTNAELTEALQHVWNKKMTTSQASRIFGIPYNSLLMYVRGKYGKSLKLEQLRKDCIGGPAQPPMDILGNMNGNNNNMPKNNERDPEPLQNPRPSSTDQDQPPQPHPLFNPFGHSFYPDFGTGFPIPVSMIHLLPQSEKNRAEHQYGQTAPHEEEMKSNMAKELDEESGQQNIYRPPSLNSDDRRELVQQNGQD